MLAELREMAGAEDAFWETGKVSGTMYCGDHDHYAFLTEAFGMFAHTNVLQRDMCPSATRFEGEIIAMALDLMHADAVTDTVPAGLVTSGGTGSILHALLAYREHAAATRGIDRRHRLAASASVAALSPTNAMAALRTTRCWSGARYSTGESPSTLASSSPPAPSERVSTSKPWFAR